MHFDLCESEQREATKSHGTEVSIVQRLDNLETPSGSIERGSCPVQVLTEKSQGFHNMSG
jgi:hypothetical protein